MFAVDMGTTTSTGFGDSVFAVEYKGTTPGFGEDGKFTVDCFDACGVGISSSEDCCVF